MKQTDNFNKLFKIIYIPFFLIFFLIIFFLIRWQFFDPANFKGLAKERLLEKSVSSIRGDILARDNTTLAYSEIRYDVFAYLVDIENAETQSSVRAALQTRSEFTKKVSTILGISEDEISSKLTSGGVWIKLASKIDCDTKKLLENIPTDKDSDTFLTGLNFELTSERIYPEETLASHIIGFLGKDLNSNDIGRGGIEQKYNGTLEPQEGYIASETDKFGNIIAISDSVSIRAKRGSTIKTTIDPVLQKITEKKIKEGVEKYQALSGSILIMDPETGEILAWANFPDFDPSKYYMEEDGSVFTNRALSVPYEIGSVAKVFTMSAAIERLGIKPTDIISEGHDGCIEITASGENDVRTICTFDKLPQGPLTATEALIKSDNLAFATLGLELGKENLHEYLSAFGVGEPTNIDLSGESIGYLPALNDPKAWHPVDVAVFSYGHGYQMNLLQAVRGVSVIANRGWMMQPYIVSEITDSNGNINKFEPITIRKVVNEETTEGLIVMMEELFKNNTDKEFAGLSKYPVAAKSGTGLIPYKDKAGYSSDINATFVGFDTSEDRKFVMAVRLESPQAVEKLSFYSARPLWMETYKEIKDHFNIQPLSE